MIEPINVFDRRLMRQHRERAAKDLRRHDFLIREVAERLADRLDDVKRSFPYTLDLGCRHGVLYDILAGRGDVELLVQCDASCGMARLASTNGQPTLIADEEMLPFAEGSFDLVLSVLNLHWVNDLPGTLIQVRRALKPDGLLLAALFGGDTLQELRTALMQAELAEEQGASPRVAPFVGLRDAGGLLQRAGFALPVVDVETITVTYPDVLALMRDVRGMGEANPLQARCRHLSRRATLLRAMAIYEEMYAGVGGRVPASFEVIYLTAWAPHDLQPRPLRPGTARARLATALETEEVPAGDKARPK